MNASSSSCHAISMDITNPLSPLLPIIHCFWQVFRGTSSICTELLYVCSSWTSCLCSSLWRGPQEYITYKLAPPSPAVSRMSGSWRVVGCRTVAVLWGAVSRTSSILLATFLCNCRQVFSPYVSLVSMCCTHVAESILPLLGRNCASLYRSGLISIWPIAYRLLSTPLLVVCRCLSRLIRHCSLGRWTCQLISKRNRLVWRCRLFDWSIYIPSCVRWQAGRCQMTIIP